MGQPMKSGVLGLRKYRLRALYSRLERTSWLAQRSATKPQSWSFDFVAVAVKLNPSRVLVLCIQGFFLGWADLFVECIFLQ